MVARSPPCSAEGQYRFMRLYRKAEDRPPYSIIEADRDIPPRWPKGDRHAGGVSKAPCWFRFRRKGDEFYKWSRGLSRCVKKTHGRARILAREQAFRLAGEKLRARMAESYGVMKQAVQRSLRQVSDTMGGLIGGRRKSCICTGRPAVRSADRSSPRLTYAMGDAGGQRLHGIDCGRAHGGFRRSHPGRFPRRSGRIRLSDGQMVDALFHAGAVGYLIMRNATISGAEGGCQAEVGSAGAMAASAVAALMERSPPGRWTPPLWPWAT